MMALRSGTAGLVLTLALGNLGGAGDPEPKPAKRGGILLPAHLETELKLNEEQFPTSSNLSTFRGNISLMKGDTAAAIAAFREAVRRDSTNGEAQGRLRQLTRP